MATVVTNAFYTDLGIFNDRPHALLYVNNMIWIGCESDPGRFLRVDPANPSVVTAVALPNDGAHKWIVDMCYIPAKGRIYALCGDPFASSAITTVVEINPATGAFTDVIVDPSYNVQQGSFTFDGTYMYILSRATSTMYRYRLSDWAFISDGYSGVTFGHCIRYDSVSGKLFLTSSGQWPNYPMISRVNPATFLVEQVGFWEPDKIFSDDIAFAGNYVYAGSEITGNLVKFQKDNLAVASHIPMGIAGRNFGVYFDGGVLWTGWEGNAGLFAKVDPATEISTLYQMPQAFSVPGFFGSVNEWVRSTTNLYMTGYGTPGWVSQLTVTDFDPVVPPGTVQLLFGDTLELTDNALAGDPARPGVALADSLNLRDSVGTSRVQANPLSDTLTFLDAIQVSADWRVAVSDALNLLDNGGGTALVFGDTLTLSDSVLIAAGLPAAFNVQKMVGDQLQFRDLFAYTIPNGAVSVSDSLFLQDKMRIVKNSLRNDYLRHYLNDVVEIIPETQFVGASGTDEVFLPQGGSAMAFADAVAITVT